MTMSETRTVPVAWLIYKDDQPYKLDWQPDNSTWGNRRSEPLYSAAPPSEPAERRVAQRRVDGSGVGTLWPARTTYGRRQNNAATTQQICVCGNPSTPNTIHRYDGPCYREKDMAINTAMSVPLCPTSSAAAPSKPYVDMSADEFAQASGLSPASTLPLTCEQIENLRDGIRRQISWIPVERETGERCCDQALRAIELVRQVADKDREIARLEQLVYVPGVFKCAKCGLSLISTTLNVVHNLAKANNDPQQCPNGCGPLWRKTERDAGNELCDSLEKAEHRVKKLEGQPVPLSEWQKMEQLVKAKDAEIAMMRDAGKRRIDAMDAELAELKARQS